VYFAIAADAERARVEMSGKRIEGRNIQCDVARKRMPVEMRGKTGATASKAPAPAAAKGAEAGPAVPKKPKSQRANTDGSLDGRTVLVTGLAKDATKQQIYNWFKKIATIDLPALILKM
jgi:hypothetical protein